LNQGTFDNNTGGTIRLDNSYSVGLKHVSGTFTNAASIVIGATVSVGSLGLQNGENFNNNTGGTIQIDRSSLAGLMNDRLATFTNAASITIGALASTGTYGLWNRETFRNNTGGHIKIDNAIDGGLNNTVHAVFANAGSVIIGATAAAGKYALQNIGTFDNNAGGDIQIDRAISAGLYNSSGTFTNAASIIIGATASAGKNGLWNRSTFTNNTRGVIQIDRSTTVGLYNSAGGSGQRGNFTNEASITIGAIAPVGEYGLYNEVPLNTYDGVVTFSNNSCATLTLFAPLSNTTSFTNNGAVYGQYGPGTYQRRVHQQRHN
jgi:hypothetical protein